MNEFIALAVELPMAEAKADLVKSLISKFQSSGDPILDKDGKIQKDDQGNIIVNSKMSTMEFALLAAFLRG